MSARVAFTFTGSERLSAKHACATTSAGARLEAL
jgi:hypothetical protein